MIASATMYTNRAIYWVSLSFFVSAHFIAIEDTPMYAINTKIQFLPETISSAITFAEWEKINISSIIPKRNMENNRCIYTFFIKASRDDSSN